MYIEKGNGPKAGTTLCKNSSGNMQKRDRKESAKICRSRTKRKIHVEVIITNAQGDRRIFQELEKALIKVQHFLPISYAIIRVDFPE